MNTEPAKMAFFGFTGLLCLALSAGMSSESGTQEIDTKDSPQYRRYDAKIERTTSATISDQSSAIPKVVCDSDEWRKYDKFDRWTSNYPTKKLAGAAAFSTGDGDRRLNHLIYFGGSRIGLSWLIPQDDNPPTWIYTFQSNSWIEVRKFRHPPKLESPKLVNLCSQSIFLFGSLGATRHRKVSAVWKFDIKQREWTPVDVLNAYPDWGTRYVHPVVATHTTTTCECRKSILFFPWNSDGIKRSKILSLTRLACIKKDHREIFQWETVNALSSKSPENVEFLNLAVERWTGCVALFVVSTRILWHLRVSDDSNTMTWTVQKRADITKGNAFTSSATIGIEPLLLCATVDRRGVYIVFNTKIRMLIMFDSDNDYRVLTVVGEIPWPASQFVLSVSSLAFLRYVVHITSDDNVGGASTWTLEYDARGKVWVWNKVAAPKLQPYSRSRACVIINENDLFLVGGMLELPQTGIDYSPSLGRLWTLDLTVMRWTLLSITGGLHQDICKGSVWLQEALLDATTVKWPESPYVSKFGFRLYNATDASSSRRIDIPRELYGRSKTSLVAIGSTFAILFGGQEENKRSNKENELFNDVWQLSLRPTAWSRIPEKEMWPAKRYGHAAVVVGSTMFVFGGKDGNGTCLNDFWSFDVDKLVWKRVNASNRGPSLAKSIERSEECFYSGSSTEGQLWFTVVTPKSQGCRLETWTYILHLRLWHIITNRPDKILRLPYSASLSSVVLWRETLLALDTVHVSLYYLPVRCPGGFESLNISLAPCNFCRKGSYRPHYSTSTRCLSCPGGLTTQRYGAQSISECSECLADQCQHGKCVASNIDGKRAPRCRCFPGFTGSKCQYATYYFIGMGLVLCGAFATLAIVVIVSVIKRRKRGERAYRRHIEEILEVWQIGRHELYNMELIAVGGFADVYKAIYRDFVVAVKTMRVPQDRQLRQEFESEIRFMQTIRHENIVLFIGAGKSVVDAEPFLVTEYTQRGSLRDVLDNSELEITTLQKINFAFDAAKGMNFLHTLSPPRLHRDLKSPNLLVSHSWTVKVADFGFGRPLPEQRRSRQSGDRVSDLAVPLLEIRDELSFRNVGTIRWNAPELSLGHQYNTAVDVYR